MTNPAIYRMSAVQSIIGFCRSTIYKQIHDGLFPKPVSIGARAIGFIPEEVHELVKARIMGLSDDSIRQLVESFHTARPSRFSMNNPNDNPKMTAGRAKHIADVQSGVRKAPRAKQTTGELRSKDNHKRTSAPNKLIQFT
jgi:prophage regulatory protein